MGSAVRGRPARARTPRGVGADFKGFEVLQASGRNCLGQLRVAQTQNFATKLYLVMNRKVVDLTILYNFYKGSRVFFSTDFA
jgi:hypothetical protein